MTPFRALALLALAGVLAVALTLAAFPQGVGNPYADPIMQTEDQ